ncbi:type IX secretion system sortase PorU [Empedobacter sp. 225-1]|uniref:type IX secretion system sortase PorU n=1 Tax=unclassified Empedobacter TaxID=2643773 RepID=UPI0025771054|nr:MULTISPECIES: type IX secretion system sortase PorU [unclassified Empedobacter]MDM1522744.1 type IX secretion system sortase PorU [Empedobacter sp. 225-1]MDM1542330.1 type IX secretion system sortase PorU [Empedobacter sp. 189-2]
MKKYFILVATLLQFPQLFSQNYKINWENNQTISLTNGNKVNVPYFSNKDNYFVGGYFLPEFVVELNSLNQEVELTNVQYREVQNELIDLDTSSISDKINFSSYNVNDKNGQQKLIVKVVPFVKQNNKFLKIESFSIVQKPISSQRKSGTRFIDNSTSSVLKTGDWYKIKVSKDGVFKLDRNFFTKNGIPTNFNPKSLKIYGNGEGRLMENLTLDRKGALNEIPIKFVGGDDGSFDNNDYVLFYAKGPHQWYRDNTTTLSNVKLRYNLYDESAYYFISFNGSDGKRVQNSSLTGSPVKTFSTFDHLQFHEKDSINLNGLGQIWVGENIGLKDGFKKTFKANSIVNGGEAYLRYAVVGKNSNNNYSINANGQIFTGSLGNSEFNRTEDDKSITLNSNTIDISVSSVGSNPSGLGFLDYLQLRFKDNLVYNNEQFTFRFLSDYSNPMNAFTLQNSSNVNVWNVSNIHQISNLQPESGSYKFENSPQNEFVAFRDENAYNDAKFVGRVANQDIRSLVDINYVVITHPKYLDQAQRLANFRKEHDKINTAVVTTDQVYNDFSSGSQDPIAIRDFLKFLKDNQSPNLEYAVLFGATTYDPKNRIKDFTNYIPTFTDEPSTNINEAIATDDYFAMLDNNVKMLSNNVEGVYNYDANWFNIAVGRIPASNSPEAKVLVDKIISYYDKVQGKGTSYGDWRTKVVAVTDNDDNVNTPNFDVSIDGEFTKKENQIYTVNKIYTGAHQPEGTSAGVRYPTVNQAILNGIELGSNFLMYYGHGGPRSWAQERIITAEELTGLSNFSAAYSRLPIVCTVTCDFTIWDLPQYNSAGEMMLKNINGGALSMITTNRPIGTGYGDTMNQYLIQEFFKKDGLENQTIGKALNQAKISYSPSHRNHKSVSILGDPMLAIHRPQQEIEILSIENKKGVDILGGGKLQALDFVTIKGKVNQLTSTSIDNTFSGKIAVSLFEKEEIKTLLSESTHNGKTFKTENKTIYKGTGKVVNGEFTIQFYVPKDINYELGDRKLKFYAWDEKDGKDASTLETVSIEGINEEGLDDDERPQGKLYMNNLNFANGGITDRSPYLVGCLTDNTGINATGSSIGHDIVATIDGKVQDAYVLNEYYDGGDANPCINKDFEDYQKGQVMYQLKNLELGQHTVNLKFWDINNNSNTATLDFVVMENGTGQLHIDKLLNWPNPFTKNTFFHFEHNCDSELDVMVQIFTISGKLVKTLRQTVSAEPFREGYRTGKYAIEWDGLDDFGDKIGKGVYIYKVNVKGVDDTVCKGSAAAVEKLVILK